MKVTGFSFVKNAIKYDYPIVESITSILPICDEFVIAVGDCNDGTRELIESIGSDKIRIIDTVWDESLREGGKVLADETNKAFDAIDDSSDWAFYIQGDEVVVIGKSGDNELSAEEVSELAGSFNYELLCDLGKRIPRVYYRHGKVVGSKDYNEDDYCDFM